MIRNLVRRMAEWGWKHCWNCNWPVPDNSPVCNNCGAGQAN